MATLTAARLLHLDQSRWRAYQTTGSVVSAVGIALGAYVAFALSRFGISGVFGELRAVVRFLLIGFYGWLWLAGAAWATNRLVFRSRVPLSRVFRLFGFAHLPLLLAAILILFLSVTFPIPGPGLIASLFVAGFWMPALLVAAVRQALSVGLSVAMMLTAGPYVAWVLVVGRLLFAQLRHFL